MLHDSLYFQNFVSFSKLLVSVCSAALAVSKSQQVRSCPGQCGMLLWEQHFPLPLPSAQALPGRSELKQDVTGGGKGDAEVFWEDE